MFLFFVWLSGSLLTIASQWLFAAELHESLQDYVKYFWIVIIELVSGFDIPDDIPLHYVSQLVSILMLIMGLVVVGLFTGQIISMFVHVLQKAELFSEKPENFQFDKPIIVCGCNERIYNIIENLRSNSLSSNREIILIDNNAHQLKKKHYKQSDDIWYLSGDPADREVLEKAIGKSDCRVIILSKDLKDKKWSNAMSINTALAIEAFDESVHTVVEIVDIQSMNHFKRTKINDWVCVSEFSLKLISQSALQPGMANVFSSMLGKDSKDHESTRIRFSSVPLADYFAGKSYAEISKIFLTDLHKWDATLVGFARYIEQEEKERLKLNLRNSNYFIQINPLSKRNIPDKHSSSSQKSAKLFFYKDTILNKKDKLIYLARQELDFRKISSHH
ncbi:MAG: NAD-binding protein [bacterium]